MFDDNYNHKGTVPVIASTVCLQPQESSQSQIKRRRHWMLKNIKFREWDGRPPPSFSVSEYEETTTNDNNINDDSCSDEVNNIVEL